MYAYDASNYRVPPVAVAFPRTVKQVQELVRACAGLGVPVTTRGAGTSMAGNAIGPGVVVDLSRHLDEILDIDPAARRATVQAGVVLDRLNAATGAHGLMFAPDPSSRSRATIGGMVGNDACGNHSVRWGRTSAHVESLDIVLPDGCLLRAGAGTVTAVDQPDAPADAHAIEHAAQLTTQLTGLVQANLAEIRTELGRIQRQVSGYHLDELLPERGFHVARALAGSEGTCALTVAATLTLVERPTRTTLLVLGYDDIVDAAADVPAILPFAPTAVEGIDEAIVATMIARRGPESVASLPAGRAWLYVELDAATDEELVATAERLLSTLRENGRLTDGLVVTDLPDRAALWRVREDGAGLSTRPDATTQTWAGWEDAAVDPADLAGYLRDFRALLAEHDLSGVLYGHFGAGCVHVRINFDLATDDGTSAMATFVRAAARLVAHHGGSISGEHGDGRARSELLAAMYSPQMLALFARFRHVFDPEGVLNPGVIVEAAPLARDLLPLSVRNTSAALSPTGFAYPHDRDFTAAAQRCVGVGRCRSDHGGFMCPSYRATRQEQDSTRGRARVLQELTTGSLLGDGWRSDQVHQALDLCLSCKACSSDCPVGVDMATYKSEVLHQRYRRRLRPRSHYSLGWLPRWISMAGRAPALVNAALAIRPLRHLASRMGGVTTQRTLPRFAPRREAALRAQDENPDLLLFTDTFTRGFRPDLVRAAEHVLRSTGLSVAGAPQVCCALTWITTGQLDAARRILTRAAGALDATGNVPIVVLEPSCAAVLKKDLPELVDSDAARRVAARVTTFGSVIESRLDAGWTPPQLPPQALTQTHCHQHAVFGAASNTRVLRRLGMGVTESEGCCGLAGNFGFEAEHYETSMAVAQHDLAGKLAGRPADAVTIADGFSCQCQINHLTSDAPDSAGPLGPGTPARHLAEVLNDALTPTPKIRPKECTP
nr:FAD-binding and (Fe-S)-binding domain-containing protein [Terrabacter sp. MAHUQ-38]